MAATEPLANRDADPGAFAPIDAPLPSARGGDRGSLAAVVTVASAAIAAAGQVLFHNRVAFPVALSLAVTAGLLALGGAQAFAASGAARARRWTSTEIVGLGALLAFALFIRLWQNGEWPIGVSYDESTNGVEATGLMRNPTFPIWSEALSGRPTLHLHILALTFKVFGPSPEALRGVSALVGTLAIVPLYLLGRWAGGPYLAFAAAGFLAISRWDLSYSRLGYEAIFGPLCAGSAIYTFLRGWEERRFLYWALCGLSLALGLYTYVAFRLFPFAITAMALVALIHDLRKGEGDRARALVRGLGVALAILIVVTAPLLNFARTDWARFSHRFQEVSVFNEMRSKGSAEPLIENVKRHVGMFNYRGGIRAATNLPFHDSWQPGYPMLGIPFAAFFIVGFWRNLRRLGSPLGMGLFATLVTSLTAGALTVTLETPHQTRAFIAVVPAAFMAGDGLVATAVALAAWLRAIPLAAPSIITVVLAIAAVAEGDTYRHQLAHPEAWYDFDGSTNMLARAIRTIPPDTRIVVSATMKSFPAHHILQFVAGRDLSAYKAFDAATDLPYRSADRPVTYMLTPVDHPLLSAGFAAAYPTVQPELLKDPFGRIQGVRYDVPRDVLAVTMGLRHERFANPDCIGAATETRSDPGPRFGLDPAPPGVACERWSGVLTVPSTGRYRVLLDAPSGASLVATLDGLPLDGEARHLVAGYAAFRAVRVGGAGGPWSVRLAPEGAEPEVQPSFFARPDLAHGLIGTYFTNAQFEGEPIAVRRDWSLLPAPILEGAYSIIWRGFLAVPETGPYTLLLVGDDASQLWIDGELVLDANIGEGRPVAQKQVELTAGKRAIEVRFRNSEGGQSFELDWTLPRRGTRDRIPLEALTPY